MTPVSVGEYHGLRVGSALLSIVAGCIIIGVSRECDADAVGGIFLGAGGLGEYAFGDTNLVEYCPDPPTTSVERSATRLSCSSDEQHGHIHC